MAWSSGWNKHFFFNPANFSVLSCDISPSFPIIYQNSTWIVSLLPSFKNVLKKSNLIKGKSMVSKNQKWAQMWNLVT